MKHHLKKATKPPTDFFPNFLFSFFLDAPIFEARKASKYNKLNLSLATFYKKRKANANSLSLFYLILKSQLQMLFSLYKTILFTVQLLNKFNAVKLKIYAENLCNDIIPLSIYY